MSIQAAMAYIFHLVSTSWLLSRFFTRRASSPHLAAVHSRSRSLGHSVSHRCCRLLLLWLHGLRKEKSARCISLFAGGRRLHAHCCAAWNVWVQTACQHTACGQQSAIFCTVLSGCVHSSMCKPTRLQCYDEAFSWLDLNKLEAPLIYTFLSWFHSTTASQYLTQWHTGCKMQRRKGGQQEAGPLNFYTTQCQSMTEQAYVFVFQKLLRLPSSHLATQETIFFLKSSIFGCGNHRRAWFE